MINDLVMGRLGNQMFQYAAMRCIQEKYYQDEIINMNFDTVRVLGKKEDGFDNQLTMFRLNEKKIVFDKNIIMSKSQKIIYYKHSIISKLIRIFFGKKNFEKKKKKYELKIQKKYNKRGLFIFNYGYYSFPKVNIENKIFKGYFESANYFNDIKNLLFIELSPKYEKLDKNINLYKYIENNESVCISIRRGDFLANEHKKDCFICDNNYFYKAISEIKKRLANPKFIVFSDDVEWCKNNMNFPSDTRFEDGNDPLWEKMRLMYSCKNFIISNSTFSWWAQYLSRNDNKIVIAPKKWRNNNYVSDIYEKNWILI